MVTKNLRVVSVWCIMTIFKVRVTSLICSLGNDAIVWVNIAQCIREKYLEFCHALCLLLRLELLK